MRERDDPTIVKNIGEKPALTPAQEEAIKREGDNLLVSASAGSGKTFVMIERVVRLILEGKAEVDGILAVTYTRLAAEEMKKKLVAALRKKIAEGKDKERFRRSLDEVPQASICTFDSFCASLLKSYFYAVGLDPMFSVLDETESVSLKKRAIDKLFSDKYTAGDEDFLYLARIYRRFRGDDALKGLVVELSLFASSEAYPDKFLDFCAEEVTEETFGKFAEKLREVFSKKLSAAADEARRLKENCEKSGADKYAAFLSELLAHADSAAQAKSPSELLLAASADDRNVPPVRKTDETLAAVGDEVKAIKGELSAIYKDIRESFALYESGEALARYMHTARAERALCRLAKQFDEYYSEMKKADGKTDFSDLEHLTLKLLTENPAVLDELKARYKYVFADEYQDVNGVQEKILSLLTEGNLFMVGDVKQSIYAFRGCNPEIFAKKYDEYSRADGGTAVSLDANFRSSDGILNAVNKVFSRIMTKDFGGIDYAGNLMHGNGLYPTGYGEAKLHLIEGEKAEKKVAKGLYNVLKDMESDDESDDFYEGALAARIISEELGSDMFDVKTGEVRQVSLGDVAVLTRPSSGFATRLVKELTRRGIPVSSEAGTSVCAYPEVKLLVCVLRLIAFYADDVPLAAVLKSRIGGLDEEQLAEIRRPYKRKNGVKTFAACVEDYAETGPDEEIRKKLKNFSEYFGKIRLLAEFCGASEILARVMRETGLDLEIASMPLGRTRLARVERLIAEGVRDGRNLTVTELLDVVDSAPEKITSAEVAGENTVRIMSMHASKGLEFPVVIIAGVSRKFNFDDLRGDMLLSRSDGLALKCYDESSMTVFDTLVGKYFKEAGKLSAIREEARLFYVAMTRAKCRMHLICEGSVAPKAKSIDLLTATGFSDFLTLDDMPVVRHDRADLRGDARRTAENVLIGRGRQSLTDRIKEQLNFVYPFGKDTVLPVKRTVTKLLDDGVFAPFSDLPDNGERRVFASSAEKGTAYHRFMEKCDLRGASAAAQTERLLKEGLLTPEQAKMLSPEILDRVLACDVFDSLDGFAIYREQPFITSLSAEDVPGVIKEGQMLVQGIIDLLAIRGDSAVIIDYKTSSGSAESLAAHYKAQLDAYAAAVKKTLGLKVVRKVILNLVTAQIIDL